uniref:Uncharacterized protein n=1 Tax=Rhizophora mucronata TaxID=61149 RepID=A0A2P2QC00_RHIMU
MQLNHPTKHKLIHKSRWIKNHFSAQLVVLNYLNEMHAPIYVLGIPVYL